MKFPGPHFLLLAAFLGITFSLWGQQVRIAGTVRDNKGETVIGATISVKGTTQGTVTDADGRFELTVPSLPQTLVISNVGFQPTEIVFEDAARHSCPAALN